MSTNKHKKHHGQQSCDKNNNHDLGSSQIVITVNDTFGNNLSSDRV